MKLLIEIGVRAGQTQKEFIEEIKAAYEMAGEKYY